MYSFDRFFMNRPGIDLLSPILLYLIKMRKLWTKSQDQNIFRTGLVSMFIPQPIQSSEEPSEHQNQSLVQVEIDFPFGISRMSSGRNDFRLII